ncbi:hypothetical protein PIROE2DRAFT_13719 [Piromyces sp. E2]|nr:hypothetical protein PIROE2DRAFT_13719 [Piromyces sp. E2]|eukprot:OUM60522.1 hypothetical protein PIROE2DRAFT_13719 [Piromyces sp. E2]
MDDEVVRGCVGAWMVINTNAGNSNEIDIKKKSQEEWMVDLVFNVVAIHDFFVI